jgi:adenosylmethionine-8-amino-7-oxononanoate aminotransferase
VRTQPADLAATGHAPDEWYAPASEHLIGPDLRARAPVFVRGEGVELIAADGRRYLDAASGVGVTCLGYSAAEVVEAMRAQAERLPYLHALRFEAPPAQQLADLVADVLPGDLDQVFFASGGSEANESAIKFARQYWLERGQPERWRVIGRKPSFHGNTLATLSVGWHAGRRQRHAPLLLPMPHVPAPNVYRGCGLCPQGGISQPEAGGQQTGCCELACAAELERRILEVGPQTVAAFIAEPVIAAAGGALVPPPGYFTAVRDICDRYGVLLIADEVFTGFGRLGRWAGLERFGVQPDLMVFAKGITAGYAPLGGFAVRGPLLDPFRRGTGRFEHNFTFAGHPVAAAVGVAVVEILRRDRLVERVAETEPWFFSCLRRHLGDLPVVGDIRGLGLLAGVELVADRDSKRPFPAAAGTAARATALAMDEGVVVYPCSGGVDGGDGSGDGAGRDRGDYLLLAPPFVATEDELEQMVVRLARALGRLTDERTEDGHA